MNGPFGLGIAVLDYYGAIEMHSCLSARTFCDRLAAAYHNGAARNHYAPVGVAFDELSRGRVEDGGRRGDDNSAGYDGSFLDRKSVV